MISERKIAANRENAKRSTGPRTPRSKSRSKGNALRHGLEAVNFTDPELSEKVERLATAICPDKSDPFRFEQAISIAESQILITRVRAARINIIRGQSRQRKGVCKDLPLPGCMTLHELDEFGRDLRAGNLRKATRTIQRMTRAWKPFYKMLMAAITAKNEHERIEARRQADRMILARIEETTYPDERDEIECARRALSELLRLDRYERRALSRRNRAIRRFDALSD